mmetsp:Transcript_6866/g.10460  ORF Transcript_6866/g.10460 Transcript_6866/m.10460 type:complete len:323 (+) Transcript_6866:115-1083(+)
MGKPPRVISVLPSATEILCLFGGSNLLVGRSHEDNFPRNISHLPVLTGQKTTFTTAADVDAQVSAALGSGESLYTLDVDTIRSLAPIDVILTQDLCAVCAIDLETVERLAAGLDPRPVILSLNPENIEDVLADVLVVGAVVHMEAEAKLAHAGLLARMAAVDAAVARAAPRPATNVAFMEWPDPIYVGGHWTPQLIQRAGGAHPLNPATAAKGGGAGKSYAVPHEEFVDSDPDLIVVCPCGLDLAMIRTEMDRLQGLTWWRELRAVKSGRVALVDGDAMFNRPGPRLVDAFEWLASVFLERPELAQSDFPVEWLKPSLPPNY